MYLPANILTSRDTRRDAHMAYVASDRGWVEAPKHGLTAYVIRERVAGGEPYYYAVPEGRQHERFTASGAFLWSTDSRFRELYRYPVPIHDRPID